MKGRRASSKVVRLTTFQTVRRGNWFMRFSVTDMNTIMLLANSATDDTNIMIKFFNTEEEAVSFVDFLAENESYCFIPSPRDISSWG